MLSKKKYCLLSILLLICTCSVAQTLGAVKERFSYVGVPKNSFREIATFGKQHNMNWCWAACIQMVLNFYKIPIVQEQVVKRTLGKLVDKPANPDIMFKALNGWEVDVYGNNVLVNSNFYSTSVKEITAFLVTQKPLIVGLKQQETNIGHAYVLIGMHYEKFYGNEGETIVPHSVLLVDPWPGNTNVLDMSWSDFTERLIVTYKVWVN